MDFIQTCVPHVRDDHVKILPHRPRGGVLHRMQCGGASGLGRSGRGSVLPSPSVPAQAVCLGPNRFLRIPRNQEFLGNPEPGDL